jgi:hypothetical protein
MPRAPLVFALLALATIASAQTEPLLTEEATAAPAGHLALELGGDFIAAARHYETGQTRARWDAPRMRLVYSAADSVEFDVEWVARVGASSGPGFSAVSDFGDVTLRSKVRLRDGGEHSTTLGTRFVVTLPQTTYGLGLGPDTLRMSAQGLVTIPAASWRLHANAGLAIQDEVYSPHEQADFFAYGLAVERRVGRVALVSELAGWQGRGAPGADAHGEARAGVRVDAARLRWHGALRHGLTTVDGEWGVTVGLSLVLHAR